MSAGFFKQSVTVDGLAFAVFTFIIPTILILAFVLFTVARDWDPLYFISGEVFQELIKFSLVLKSFRFIISLVVQSSWMNIKTVIVIELMGGVSLINIEKFLLTQPVNCKTITLLQQLQIERNVMVSFEKIAIFVLVSGTYTIMVVGYSILVYGLLLQRLLISFFAGCSVAVVFCVILLALRFSCTMHDVAVATINKGKQSACQLMDVVYFRKVLKSLRALYVPAAVMGIIDREMILNFFTSVVVNLVSGKSVVVSFDDDVIYSFFLSHTHLDVK